jgi:hypothetical protein
MWQIIMRGYISIFRMEVLLVVSVEKAFVTLLVARNPFVTDAHMSLTTFFFPIV